MALSKKHLPRKKVAAAGAGGAVATFLITLGAQFGFDVSPELASATATLLAFAAGYLKGE